MNMKSIIYRKYIFFYIVLKKPLGILQSKMFFSAKITSNILAVFFRFSKCGMKIKSLKFMVLIK
jgi:hypothetical protein